MEFTAIVGVTASSYLSPSSKLRTIIVPDDRITNDTDTDLDLIFEFGQNDFQPANVPSVSTGDIIIYKNIYFRVEPIGWTILRPIRPDNA